MSEEPAFVLYGQPIRGRSCGSCKACCTQVPVDLPTGHKAANVACGHLCSKGCKIYAARPHPCQVWSCRWLFDAAAAGLKRPDKSGYIIDPMLDRVLANEHPAWVLQVWVDPARRDAHRDPALRDYLESYGAKHQLAAIIRWSNDEAMVLVPPSLNSTREWMEVRGDMLSQKALDEKIQSVSGNCRAMRVAATVAATEKF